MTEPEVRHYIGVWGELGRMSVTMTAHDSDGLIHDRPGRHPWDPIDGDNGCTYYRVSETVAAAFMADDDDDEDEDAEQELPWVSAS